MDEDPGAEAWMLLFKLLRAHRREMTATRKEPRLNPAQAHLLVALSENGPSPMKELAEQLGCDASYVTSVVDRLAGLGLVERQTSPSDRRVKLAAITADGEAAREALFSEISRPPLFIKNLSPSDQRALRDIFLKAEALAMDTTSG